MTGVVHSVGGGSYQVVISPEGIVIDAHLRGRLKLENRVGDQVVIGDRVEAVETTDGSYVIEKVLPRENAILRSRVSGLEIKVLVANVSRVLLVVAAKNPKPRMNFMDRMLVLAESESIEPLIVINKIDLANTKDEVENLSRVYRSVGYDVICTSAKTQEGIDRLADETKIGITALAGPSGAGKSSLINCLDPKISLRTSEVSAKHGSGRHTTVRSRLISLSGGGWIADTPGFSNAGVKGLIGQNELGSYFPEFITYLTGCQFRSCSHTHEPNCSVRHALAGGSILESRFQSYRTLYEEIGES